MATTSWITGRFVLPDNAAPTDAVALFVLSGFDTDGNEVVSNIKRSFNLEADGDMPAGAQLWRNVAGLRGRFYNVFLTVSMPDEFGGMARRVELSLGRVQVREKASYTVAELLNSTPFPDPPLTLIPGPRGPQGPAGPRGFRGFQGEKGDPGNYLGMTLIGASTNIADRPASAATGEAWGLIGSGTIRIFIWSGSAWLDAGPITTPESFPVANTIFVQEFGNNANSGTSWGTAVRHIERALELAELRGDPTLIEWGPGSDESQGHLDLPDMCVIRAAYRGRFITPSAGFEDRNIFRMGDGCFIEGVVAEGGWRVNDPNTPTEGFFASFRPGAVITRPPYIHKCAMRAQQPQGFVGPALDPLNGNPGWPVGPGVILADGMVCSKYSIFPNILAWGATPVGYNGFGYRARNGGLVHAVGAVGMWSHKHFVAESGGKIQLSGCETQFGDYSLVADGSRNVVVTKPMTASLTAQGAAADAIAAARATIINDMWTALVAGGFTAGWDAEDETYTRFDADVWVRAVEHMLRGAASDPVERFQKLMFDAIGDRVFSPDKLPGFVFSFNHMRDSMQALAGVGAVADAMIADATAKLNDTISTPEMRTEVSVVEAIAHKWTGQGSGVWAVKAPPINAKWTIKQSILEIDGGRVIATGQDSDRNAELGGEVSINARFGLTGRGFIDPVKRQAMEAAITYGGF